MFVLDTDTLYITNCVNGELQLSKKSLKIPKGLSESILSKNRDNTMAKRKSTKGQTTINKTYI